MVLCSKPRARIARPSSLPGPLWLSISRSLRAAGAAFLRSKAAKYIEKAPEAMQAFSTLEHIFVLQQAGKSTASDATAAATAAAQAGRAKLLAASTAWWADYWPQSFVTLPVTRAEGFYYTEMYRFVSSDRVGLHGLMGAFGPTVRAMPSLSPSLSLSLSLSL